MSTIAQDLAALPALLDAAGLTPAQSTLIKAVIGVMSRLSNQTITNQSKLIDVSDDGKYITDKGVAPDRSKEVAVPVVPVVPVVVAPATPVQVVTPAQATAVRVNVGGPKITTSLGEFAADKTTVGNVYATDAKIAGTNDQALYQSERFGNFSEVIPVVPNQAYKVVLHFAEIWFTEKGKRVFNVDFNTERKLTNYDILAKVAPKTATTEVIYYTPTKSTLQVDLFLVVDNAKLSAIEVIPV